MIFWRLGARTVRPRWEVPQGPLANPNPGNCCEQRGRVVLYHPFVFNFLI